MAVSIRCGRYLCTGVAGYDGPFPAMVEHLGATPALVALLWVLRPLAAAASVAFLARRQDGVGGSNI